MFELFYKKNNNSDLFEYLEKNGFSNIQNYIPLYSKFFSLDERIAQSISSRLRNKKIKAKIALTIINLNASIKVLMSTTLLSL